jgi:hypothetical protein
MEAAKRELVLITNEAAGTIMVRLPLLKTVLMKLGTNEEVARVESETGFVSFNISEETTESRKCNAKLY